ncbi:N-succinylarginine dihydrolase [Polymorphobacter sp. PAMC 29334]|uniref:N-succinylarginine dihydrolase n=1 Tax=Polymorphobacter sp. PAMC 29334 TaxID=2862331 RepID=UPI001C6767B5|nr:N-succinylarginine dihydrolase [Polymorphobacter sp. PAMC 29334]QYE35829.1 N-succinylarginine dihydrolase [Polymorphobacter sp. PAMC 29334]
MSLEINFDGIIGPSHNYAALSLGNFASASNAGSVSRPRDAALQGLAKMRAAMGLGLVQGFFVPPDRPATGWLRQLGFAGSDDEVCAAAARADPVVFAQAMSASSMWTANAATVSPAPDTSDGRCHLSIANLARMPHRSHEATATERQVRLMFAHPAFAVHPALPTFGDEGAANHMRLAAAHAAPGVEVFVYGVEGGPFPARQSRRASEAVARRHGLDPVRTLFVEQSPAAIAAGAFHNDVVAVANEAVVFMHELAFADPAGFAADLTRLLPEATIIAVPAAAVSLADAIESYLFNSQLVTLPAGGMALILPAEARANPRVAAYLDALVASNGPIRALHFVEVRESMRNGGGPACLRLRVVADPATVDPRFLLDAAKAESIERVVGEHWPAVVAPADLASPGLWHHCRQARAKLLVALDLSELG